MTDSNRLQIAYIEEVTWGTTPAGDTQKMRVLSESFKDAITYTRSEEIRDDRLTPDTQITNVAAQGGFNAEISYGTWDAMMAGAMFGTWQATPMKYNVTSDSSLTQVTDSSDTFTVDAGGTAFVVGMLIRTTGFTNAANNGLFRVASSTSTTVVIATASLTDEAAPPAGARMKVVGFRGASADVTALADGLGSTALNFTTLGIVPGMWLKIGGSTSGEQFATAALNTFVRVSGTVTATKIPLDNLPVGWTTDSGTGKTITVYMPDYLRNGKVGYAKRSFSIEKVLLAQAVPAYMLFTGMMVNSMTTNADSQGLFNTSFDFKGKNGAASISSIDSTPLSQTTTDVMSTVADFGRVAEAGASIASPNWARRMSITINNSLRDQPALGVLGNIGIGVGDSDVTAEVNAYFGDKSFYDKYKAGTPTNISMRANKNGQAYIHTLPRVRIIDWESPTGGRNQDVMQSMRIQGLIDFTTQCSYQIDRFEEYAA